MLTVPLVRSAMYVKLFGSILKSSMWDEPHPTLRVWVALLCLADEDGIIRATDAAIQKDASGTTRQSTVSDQEFAAAMKTFQEPDLQSKDPDYGGRRLERIDGGWQILNFQKYREIRTKEQMKHAARQRRYYERQKAKSVRTDGADEGLTDMTTNASASDSSIYLDGSIGEKGKKSAGTSLVPTKSRSVKVSQIEDALGELASAELNHKTRLSVQVGVAFAYWVSRMGKSKKQTLLSVSRFRRIEHHVKERGLSWVLYCIDGAKKNPRLVQRDRVHWGLDNILPYQNTDRAEESVELTKYKTEPVHPLIHKYPDLADPPNEAEA